MPKYPFEHDGPVFSIITARFETVYYAHNKKKYKRTRDMAFQGWMDTPREEISHEEFMMTIACIERKPRHA